MIEIELPAHLRELAAIGNGRIDLDLTGNPTLGGALDALEARWPMLRGTLRDHGAGKRRPFIRFFACGEDLSQAGWSCALPEAVVQGREPLLIVGAIAGG